MDRCLLWAIVFLLALGIIIFVIFVFLLFTASLVQVQP